MAERVGFEPTYRLITDNSISSRARYGLFATFPQRSVVHEERPSGKPFFPQATGEERRKPALQKNLTFSGKSPKQMSPICSENMMPEQYEGTERIHAKLPRPSSHPHLPLPRTTYSGSFLLSSISA